MTVRRLAEEQPESFAFTAENRAWAEAQIRRFPPGRQASAVVALLWRAQEQHGWLPKPAIELVAQMLGMPVIRVYEIATFYSMFNLAPVGQHFVQLCGTTPCVLRGAEELKKVCQRRIGAEDQITADGKFSWTEVECLGACVNAPVVQVGADYYEDLTPESLGKLIDDFAAGRTPKPGPQIDRQFSAPVGGPTTLTSPAAAPQPAPAKEPALTDADAKRPGEAANVHEAAVPKPPLGDSALGKGIGDPLTKDEGVKDKPAGAGTKG